jgi:hypothetical protein
VNELDKPIHLCGYDPRGPSLFLSEARRIAAGLRSALVALGCQDGGGGRSGPAALAHRSGDGFGRIVMHMGTWSGIKCPSKNLAFLLFGPRVENRPS